MNNNWRDQSVAERRNKVVSCFEKHAGNIAAAAKELNLDRKTVREHLRNAGASRKPLVAGKIVGITEVSMKLPTAGKVKRYILTSAQNNTHVHDIFWDNLVAFGEHYKATIMVGTFSYNQNHFGKLSTKRGTVKDVERALWFDERLKPYITDKRITLAPGLTWCGETNIQPTDENPLSGFETYCGPSSVIFPHTKVEMRSVATPQGVPVKRLFTTGTVTQMNYIQKKAGLKAEHHHRYSFLIVEVDDKGRWWVRQVSSRKNGNVIQDLNVLVVNGKVEDINFPVAAITWGDLHATMAEPSVVAASYDMLDELRPQYQFIHDLMEGASTNRHLQGKTEPHKRFHTWLRGLHRVDEEVKQAKTVLDGYLRPWCTTVVPDANHDAAWFQSWLQNYDYRFDPANSELFLRLQSFMYAELRAGKLPKNVNLTERVFTQEAGLELGAVKFLLPDEPFTVCEVECGMHGHRGPNGCYGAPGNLSKIGAKATTGHTHVAGIYHGLFVAGTSTKLTADWTYTTGPSAWTHSHVVLYSTGQRAIITMTDGKWRA